MKRHAIVIGVEEYEHFSKTAFAHSDADLVAETLTELCDYPEQNTTVLKLSPTSTKSPAEILEQVRDAVSSLDVRDTVLLYFAGHGHLADGAGYLVLPKTQPDAYESTALPLNDLTKDLRRDGRVCFRIFDACHSGVDVREANEPDDQGFVRSVTTDGEGWVTIAACAADEYSIGDPSLSHGVFSHFFCEYIRGLTPGEHVLPEELRLGIAESVAERARSLGHRQNPTLNASISGIVSLGTRRSSTESSNGGKANPTGPSLAERITRIRSVPNMLEPQLLESMLKELGEATAKELEGHSDFIGEFTAEDPVAVDQISSEMQKSVIDFTRGQGIQPRHRHLRTLEEYEDPYAAMSLVLGRKTHRRANYSASQSDDLPKSVIHFASKGDGRCVPPVDVIAYVIPLQISACLLVAGFRKGWPPEDERLVHLFNAYQFQKPESQKKKVADLAPFAIRKIIENVSDAVEQRVSRLEKELTET